MLTLKEARESRGIKQIAVADALKVTRQTYAKYEEEPRNMTVLQAQAACDFIGVDIGDIFFGSSVSST
jgi:putative transcriptional regulator